MSTYKVGLQHAGSFISSGKPFLKTNSSLADGATEYIKFPNVTKKIKVKNHSTSGVLKIGFADNARRGFDMPSASVTDRFDGSFGSALSAVTVSVWLKDRTLDTFLRIMAFTGAGITDTRLQGRSSGGNKGGLRFLIEGNQNDSAFNLTPADTWVHIVAVLNGTDNRIYVNGDLVITNTNAVGGGLSNPTGISFGDTTTANHDGLYDEIYVYNTAFTTDEVGELYNSGAYFDPRDHSKAANLLSWWAFEDNAYRNYFDTADTTSTINDRIGSNNLTKGGTGTGAFVNGRQLDTAVNSHSLILSPGAEIELNVKTKSMFLFADGATQDFDVYASLTNIPSERMYDLTGPGIDE